MLYTIKQAVKDLGLCYTQVRLYVKKLGYGKLVIAEDGKTRRLLTEAEFAAIKNRIDGRTTRWQKGAQDGEKTGMA